MWECTTYINYRIKLLHSFHLSHLNRITLQSFVIFRYWNFILGLVLLLCAVWVYCVVDWPCKLRLDVCIVVDSLPCRVMSSTELEVSLYILPRTTGSNILLCACYAIMYMGLV